MFNMPEPTLESLKKHIGVLALQAGFLVLLALSYGGFALNTYVKEASIPSHITSPLAYEQQTAQTSEAVLGEDTAETPVEEPLEESETMPEPTMYPQPPRKEYAIAIYGDSMVDTMGERLEYLEHALLERYPETTFRLYNYGVGSQNIHNGLERWNKPLRYQDRDFPAITELRPDIIIVGSFAYNVLVPHDRNAHWLGYTELVQRAQRLTPHVYMLAEIAPMRRGFGFGPNGVNWEPSTAWSHTEKIIEQLENVLGLARTLQVPLIDAYSPSLQDGVKEGKRELVNPSDNIHPSVEGHKFIAKTIVDALKFR
ncbi:MAG: hypothetical protein UZ22_OP11002000426 [Microgenomates bacterium OLB23]|nr:MAG: hypothetical protein UZ22_OP11002000426 [Microgenomates bacterium OLB23]